MAEGARLESVYTLIAYRGFESLPLRQYNALTFKKKVRAFFVVGAKLGQIARFPVRPCPLHTRACERSPQQCWACPEESTDRNVSSPWLCLRDLVALPPIPVTHNLTPCGWQMYDDIGLDFYTEPLLF